MIDCISLLLRHKRRERYEFGRLMIDVERGAGRQGIEQQQLMKLFYLDAWNNCHRRNCDDRFNCRCEDIDYFTNDRECIDLSWLCDGIPDCSDGQDERRCVCSDDEFQCNVCGRDDKCDDGIPLHQCIDESRVDDGRRNSWGDCWNGNDEPQPVSRYLKVIKLFNVNKYKSSCFRSLTSSQIFKKLASELTQVACNEFVLTLRLNSVVNEFLETLSKHRELNRKTFPQHFP